MNAERTHVYFEPKINKSRPEILPCNLFTHFITEMRKEFHNDKQTLDNILQASKLPVQSTTLFPFCDLRH